MNSFEKMVAYADETGGIFSFEDLEAIPYNHWKRDVEWMVLIIDYSGYGAFVPVVALTAKEACALAIYEYLKIKDDDE